MKKQKNFQNTIVELSRSVSAYLAIYSGTYNFVISERLCERRRGVSLKNCFMRYLESRYSVEFLT